LNDTFFFSAPQLKRDSLGGVLPRFPRIRHRPWHLWAVGLLGAVGFIMGLWGIVMTGSMAVAGPAASSVPREAYWLRVQLWYDILTIASLVLLLGVAWFKLWYVRRHQGDRIGNAA